MTYDYYILRPLVQSKKETYQKQIKEEKLNQYIFDDKLYPGFVFERFKIRHDGHYSPMDIDDFKRGDFWFCTYDLEEDRRIDSVTMDNNLPAIIQKTNRSYVSVCLLRNRLQQTSNVARISVTYSTVLCVPFFRSYYMLTSSVTH